MSFEDPQVLLFVISGTVIALSVTLGLVLGNVGRRRLRDQVEQMRDQVVRAEAQGKEQGRDHNPKGFLYWLAGGGVKGGHSHGETDELGMEATTDRHHIRDLHATILHLMGLDYRKLTYFYGGLDHKLTGVQEAQVIHDILA